MAVPIRSRTRSALLGAVAAITALLVLPALAGANVQYVSVKAKDVSAAADGVVGPGDDVALTVTVLNDDPALPVSGLTGTVTSRTPGVDVVDGAAAFPVLDPGATAQASDPFVIHVPGEPSASCGDVLRFTLTLTAGEQSSSVDLAVPTGVPGPHVAHAATDVPLTVDDGDFRQSSVTLGPGILRDVRVKVSGLEHPHVGDVALELQPPQGAPITLLPAHQIEGTGLTDTVFAAKGLAIQGAASPFTGTFSAPGLGDLIGRDGAGRWTLTVRDTVSGSGQPVLDGWSLDVAPASCVPQVVARLAPSATVVAPSAPITFDASESTSPDPEAHLTYSWSVDGADDPSETAAQLVRSWPGTGVHRVSVTVSDGTHSATDEIEVAVTEPPHADFTFPGTPVVAYDTVHLDAGPSGDDDGHLVSFEWDLDGNGSWDRRDTAPSLSWAFTKAGSWNVRLRVTDDLGATAIATHTVVVQNRPPSAVLTGPAPATTDTDAVLDASDSHDLDGDIVSYAWSFGDGSPGTTTTAPTVSHRYAVPGVRTATVTVTDDVGATATDTFDLTVTDRPVAVLSADPLSGRPGDVIALTAAGSSDPDGTALTYRWSFTGASTCTGVGSSDPATTTTFSTFGDHTVTVCVTDADGAVATAQATVRIVNDPPVPSFTVAPNPAVTGVPVVFDGRASTDPDGTITAYRWDLDGDGTYETTGPTASRSYANPGTFTIRLQVTDSDGAKRTTSMSLVVQRPASGGSGGGGASGSGTGGGATGGGGDDTGNYDGSSLPTRTQFTPILGGAAIQRLAAVRRAGVAFTVRLDRTARIAVKATVAPRDAKRLRLPGAKKRKALIVGTVTRSLAAGQARVVVKLKAAVARRLAKARRVSIVLDGTVTDGAGHAVKVIRVVLTRR